LQPRSATGFQQTQSYWHSEALPSTPFHDQNQNRKTHARLAARTRKRMLVPKMRCYSFLMFALFAWVWPACSLINLLPVVVFAEAIHMPLDVYLQHFWPRLICVAALPSRKKCRNWSAQDHLSTRLS
jgi:hypothetical protein